MVITSGLTTPSLRVENEAQSRSNQYDRSNEKDYYQPPWKESRQTDQSETTQRKDERTDDESDVPDKTGRHRSRLDIRWHDRGGFADKARSLAILD